MTARETITALAMKPVHATRVTRKEKISAEKSKSEKERKGDKDIRRRNTIIRVIRVIRLLGLLGLLGYICRSNVHA